jgi:flavin reductase (DIM6/NTAB) family NADH-FMN oxidoreductase RutF
MNFKRRNSMSVSEIREDVLEKITYGFYIVTTRVGKEELSTRHRDYVAAGTVSWLMQSSFEPPMITVAVQKDSDLNETIGKADVFAANILGKEDKKLINAFADDSKIDKTQINGYDYLNGMETDCPVLKRGIGYIECKVVETVRTEGDHVLFIGQVVNSQLKEPDYEPLHEWETGKHYGGFSDS